MAELVVGLENNQKILIPTSSEARSGNPLGTILAIHSNVVPYGYLPCNGVAFDENQYPALYALLGDNHTPYSYDKSRLGEWESFTLTTTNQEMQYDGYLLIKSSNNFTIPAQDIYVNDTVIGTVNFDYGNGGSVTTETTIPFRKGDNIKISNTTNITAKVAYYTHFNVIKATSGLEETQQDYVLQSLLEADSYSTEEVATGKKWIDGKMIYRKVIDLGNLPNAGRKTINHGISLGQIIELRGMCYAPNDYRTLPYSGGSTDADIYLDANDTSVVVFSNIDRSNFTGIAIIEYTKAD